MPQPKRDESTRVDAATATLPAPNGAEPARKYLTKSDIIAANDIEMQEIEVPQWGGWLRLRTLTGRDRAAWQQASMQGSGENATVNFRESTIKLLALAIIDPETNERMWSDAEMRALARKSSAALEIVGEAVMKMNGIGKADVEALSKNSKAQAPDDDGSTD